jgi:uncharacterized membrane protein YphA (DoxX/SURF4 family)
MARWAIAAVGVAFLSVALMVAVAESHLWPATAGSVVGATLAIYGVSVVVPLIVWAVGRFQLEEAIAPVIV